MPTHPTNDDQTIETSGTSSNVVESLPSITMTENIHEPLTPAKTEGHPAQLPELSDEKPESDQSCDACTKPESGLAPETLSNPENGDVDRIDIEEPESKENRNVTPTDEKIPVIVGVGASAGGLHALDEMFENLPDNTGMAFVIVQHMAIDSPSLLPELISRRTAMKVCRMTTSMQVKPNHVYVIMPGSQLGILHGTLQVMESDTPTLFSIDHFLMALAADQGPRAIGVVLSGSGSDGSIGLKSINAEGGITFAQSEQTAEFSVMPHNAVLTGCVDYVLSPAEIAKKLAAFAHDHRLKKGTGPASHLSDENLHKIFFLLRQHTGHDFSHYKHSTLLRRIHRRMGIHHIQSLSDYIRYLQGNRAEIDKLFDDVLINVTSFFRDPELFDALRKNVFPSLFKDRAVRDPIRIWVPGCSTGEEPYSLAITLMEFFGDQWGDRPVQIFATDIDGKALAKARAGVFSEASLSAVSITRRKLFFDKVSGGFQVGKRIRDWCVFAEQDVLKDPPFSRLDLICCRNLLIYMDNSLQKKVLSIFHFALRANGVLVLGNSETASQGADWFSTVDSRQKIYVRKSTHLKPRYEFEGSSALGQASSEKNVNMGLATRNVQKEAEGYILYHYAPPAIIIDGQLEIAGFLGNTGPFIEPAPGSVSLKLLKMVHRDLVMEIRALVYAAIKDNVATSRDRIPCRLSDENRLVSLKVIPLQSGNASEKYYMILFEADLAAPSINYPSAMLGHEIPGPENDQHTLELERQLLSMREEMQSIIGEQLLTNEELQTANEEIQSANEELQSTNEELESAKEELQSTNEELATVNDELESRNEELAQLNNDLSNLLNSINLPMLMLGRDLRIRQFTPGAKPLLNLIESDIGRPFTNLRPNIDIPDFENTVLDVIEHVTSHTLEAKDTHGQWYSVNIRPYKTSDHRIAGAVVVFINISEFRFDSRESRLLTASTRESPDALTMIDIKGNFLAWNSVAERLYGFSESEALGMNILDMVPSAARSGVATMIRHVMAKEAVSVCDSVRIAKDGHLVDVLMAATGLYDQKGEVYAVSLSERDFTGLRKDYDKALKMATFLEEIDVMFMTMDLQGNIELSNHRMMHRYGYDENALANLNFKSLLADSLVPEFESWAESIVSGKRTGMQAAMRKSRDGENFSVTVLAMRAEQVEKPTKIVLFEWENN